MQSGFPCFVINGRGIIREQEVCIYILEYSYRDSGRASFAFNVIKRYDPVTSRISNAREEQERDIHSSVESRRVGMIEDQRNNMRCVWLISTEMNQMDIYDQSTERASLLFLLLNRNKTR